MAKQDTVETVWFESTVDGTVHEVVKGSPLAKRLKGEMREVAEGEFEPAYKSINKPSDSKLEHLPGYVAPAPEKAKPLTQDDVDRLVQAKLDAASKTSPEGAQK